MDPVQQGNDQKTSGNVVPVQAGTTVSNTATSSAVSAGIGGKEHLSSASVTGEYDVKALGEEQEIHPEMQKIGVSVVRDHLDVPPDALAVGVRPSSVYTPVSTVPTITLPLDDVKIEQGLHQSILTSLRWLAEWCIFQLKRVHITLKVIQGRVRRIRY